MKHILFLLLFFSLSFAKSVTTSFTYTLGDRDTKIEAKKIAFAEAKRMAIENIGVWIKTETNIVNGRLANDEINSYVMGYAKTKIVSESFAYPKYTITIELTIDEDELKRNIPETKSTRSEKSVETDEQKEEESYATEKQPLVSKMVPDLTFKNFEVGVILGSGSVNIEESSSASSQKEKSSESMGYAGVKILYNFTRKHSIQFIGGGGSSELENETLKIDTSSLAYIYHFDPINGNQAIPFLGFGITSGKAVYTDSADNETTYAGSGAILHGGFKWLVSKDGAHMLEAGIMTQSFTDEEQIKSYTDDDDDDDETTTFEKSFSLTELAFGYSYRF